VNEKELRRRPAARLLILDPLGHVLLFRFSFQSGALAGQDYWATPGGAVQQGESFEQAALREFREETGQDIESAGPEIARREFVMRVPSGENVAADERYFVVRTGDRSLSRDGWSALEREVMVEHRWWSRDELAGTTETVWPKDILEMLRRAERVG